MRPVPRYIQRKEVAKGSVSLRTELESWDMLRCSPTFVKSVTFDSWQDPGSVNAAITMCLSQTFGDFRPVWAQHTHDMTCSGWCTDISKLFLALLTLHNLTKFTVSSFCTLLSQVSVEQKSFRPTQELDGRSVTVKKAHIGTEEVSWKVEASSVGPGVHKMFEISMWNLWLIEFMCKTRCFLLVLRPPVMVLAADREEELRQKAGDGDDNHEKFRR